MIQPVVLAAGLGTRLGAVKALVSIHGRPALAVIGDTLHAAELPPALVVLGRDAHCIMRGVPLKDDQIVINPNPELGMGHSLRCAINRVPPTASGILVFHVDMPYVTSSTVRTVLSAVHAGATLAAPTYQGVRGFPVYFGRAHLAALRRSLSGDVGGKAYLATHADALMCTPVDDPGSVIDIDHPTDLPNQEGACSCATRE